MENSFGVRKGILAITAVVLSCILLVMRGEGQPDKYMSGAEWKGYLCGNKDKCSNTDWFSQWNHMMQVRIDQVAAIAEAEGQERGTSEPFRVTMVGDSTMMQQHGVMCAFLGERQDRRFDPKEHQAECCVDTLPFAGAGNKSSTPDGVEVGEAVGPRGGRGLCFRHAFQRFAAPPDEESLGYPDAVYFGSGLHFLHMCRPLSGLEPERVQGWLNYEKDLEDAVHFYRENGGEGFRLIFMTSHVIEDTKYTGKFADLLEAYRADDAEVISFCEKQVSRAAKNSIGPDGYGQDAYCRQALMDRNGSEIINRRSRPVMKRLGVPLVEGDLIVRGQAWATGKQDGRHYHALVPVEVWELLGVLLLPYQAA